MNLRPVPKPVRLSKLLATLRQYIEVAVDSHELFTAALPQSELPSQLKHAAHMAGKCGRAQGGELVKRKGDSGRREPASGGRQSQICH